MITIRNLEKSFGTKAVTKGLDLDVNAGEFLAIIGRSGEGKSVLLKQIIGLIKPDHGSILVDNISVTDIAPGQESQIFQICGYVFQFAALLDSLNIFENIAIAEIEHGTPKEELRKIVAERLEEVGLAPDVMEKLPSELSGGMRKRVGLARTLMKSPKIIFYDEPTTGLDPISTRLIHELIQKTHKQKNTTTVVISHDVTIFEYADSFAVLNGGKIVYKGPAKQAWECKDPYVWQFLRGLAEGPMQT